MNISLRCSVTKKITALLISLCMAASFVPAVGATSDNGAGDSSEYIVPVDENATTLADEPTTQATESTTQATESTTQATEPVTQATKSAPQTTEFTQTASVNTNGGFENVETEGGVLFVGTARTPGKDGGISTVKFVYSSSVNLNDKSLALINKELAACGVTMPEGMIYVSRSDIVSDSQLMTTTSERQAVFAVGSPDAPTVLKPYQAYPSVEESFERLFPGNLFNISGYASLRSVLDGRDEVKLSDDGQTASVSIVMSEDYVEKTINGKKIRILMINSELKYYFRAPKLTFVKDEDYTVSDSDVEYHYPTRSTTDPSDTLTEASTQPTSVITSPFIDDDQTGSTDSTTDATEPTTIVTPTTDVSSDEATTSSSDDSFTNNTTTEVTKATRATTTAQDTSSTTDDRESTTTERTRFNTTDTDPDRLVPYAQPIEPRQRTITSDDDPTQTVPTEPTTEAPDRTSRKTTTEPTTESTTKPTSRTTSNLTLPTTTQPTRQEPIIDPFNHHEQHAVGEAYVNTRRLPLNIRTGPGMNYMIIKVISKGTHVTVLDTSNPDWYMVRLKNKSVGYAYSYYIKFL